jgi:hypothetical protein
MNNPAFESNGSFDGILPSENHETSLTELIPPLASLEVMNPSRTASRRPSYLSVTNSDLNSHTYVYDSNRAQRYKTFTAVIY